MGVFDDDIATAKELIAEFGQTCYWQKPAPATGGVPGYPGVGTLPDPIECKMVFFSPKDLDRGVLSWRELMQASEVPTNGEIGLLAGGISFEPEVADTIRRSGATGRQWAIHKIDLLAPNGDPVLYFVTVTQ
jgi:hypothetical protein